MKKLVSAFFTATMILSVVFLSEATSSNNPLSVRAQSMQGTVSGKRKRRGPVRRAYVHTRNGVRWTAHKTKNGTKWTAHKVKRGTKWTAHKTKRGTKWTAHKTKTGTKHIFHKTKEAIN